jgi:hypothetical protein
MKRNWKSSYVKTNKRWINIGGQKGEGFCHFNMVIKQNLIPTLGMITESKELSNVLKKMFESHNATW